MAEDDFYRAVGQWVRKMRKHYHIRQEDLAEKIGLSRTSIVNIEAGRHRILLHQFVAIADAISPTDPVDQIRLATAGLLADPVARREMLKRIGVLPTPSVGEEKL